MFDVSFPDWDRELFIYLNSKNVDWLDPVMVLLSTYTAWFFLCIMVIALMIYKNRKEGKIGALFLVGGLVINTISNLLIKMLFMRPRPGNEDLIREFINQLEEAGTSYSFFSGHSSNSICLAVFTTLYFRNKIYGIAIFAWAIAVAYSRIYVGKHYPLDVMVGILFGLFTGWMAYWFYKKYKDISTAPEPEEVV